MATIPWKLKATAVTMTMIRKEARADREAEEGEEGGGSGDQETAVNHTVSIVPY
jgi:hypothetical protein